jgi:hypothetical protein
MDPVTVTTKAELKQAQQALYTEIVVKGALADKLQRARKVATMSAASIAIISAIAGGAIALAPETAGLSLGVGAVGVAAAAATTGTSVAVIIAACAIGIGLVVAVFKDYSVIEFRAGFMHLSLKK